MKYEIGQIIYRDEPVVINGSAPGRKIVVKNTGDRTIQVCSHYHFFEVNKALEFDRAEAYGMRLDIPSGTAVRFEPGTDRAVDLVPFKGARRLFGFAGWVNGPADDPEIREKAFQICREVLGHGI
jgi:urease beta subunit